MLLICVILIGISYAEIDIENPRTIGYTKIDYHSNGEVYISGTIPKMNVTIKCIPQEENVSHFIYSYGKVVRDEYENKILLQEYTNRNKNISWWINVTTHIRKRPTYLDSLEKFPPEEKESIYLQFTNYSDYSEEIRNVATSVTEGSKNTLEAAMKLAEWVNEHINYNTTYKNLFVPASQVIEKREGVCDEMSSLFISLCRVLGIPARYVSGFAYSNIGKTFGPHSWVEIYTNGIWIPIDPTYGEYGYVDASHIALYRTTDSRESVITAEYIGLTGNATTGDPNFVIYLREYQNDTKFLNMSVTLNKKTADENDYFLMTVEISNPTNKYIPNTIHVSTTDPRSNGLNLTYGHYNKGIIIPPNSTVREYYIFKTPSNLPSGMSYIHPIEVSSSWANYITASITVRKGAGNRNTYSELINQIEFQEGPSVKNISITNFGVFPRNVTDSASLKFTIKNNGNRKLQNISAKINYDGYQKIVEIGELYIGESKNISVPLQLGNLSESVNLIMEVSFDGERRDYTTSFFRILRPVLDVSIETKEKYYNLENIVFNVTITKSGGEMAGADVRIITPKGELKGDINKRHYEIGWNYFSFTNNTIKFIVNYYDIYGNVYTEIEEVEINREVSDPFSMLISLLNEIFTFLFGLFK